jgi:hypothetical protein
VARGARDRVERDLGLRRDGYEAGSQAVGAEVAV